MLTFWYHMYGSTIGNLRVYVNVTGNLYMWWQMSGNQGNVWKLGQISIGKQRSPFQIIIQGKNSPLAGRGYLQDKKVEE